MTRNAAIWTSARLPMGVAISLLVVAGCSKKSEPQAPAPPATEAPATNPTSSSVDVKPGLAVSNTPVPSLLPAAARPETTNNPTGDSDSNPIQSLNRLRTDYARAGTFDDRFDVVLKIAETRTAESVRLLQELFRSESDKDLRVELINALMGMDGHTDERLAFLSLGIARDQPPEVREAAIDGLVDLEDRRALELLRALSNDPDPAIARLARDSALLMEKMLQ